MKNFLVLSLFLFSVSVFGQATIDFETVGQDYTWTIFSNSTSGPEALSVVDNPNATGINTSAKCLKYVVNPAGDPWSGFYGQGHGSFTLDANNSMITMMVYKDVISPVNLKLEPPAVDHKVPNTLINQWEKLTFDYSSAIGTTVATITLIPDFPDPRTGGSVNYMDNIEFIHTPVPVELASFTAVAVKNGVKLEWTTATETNNKGFEIQRSLDSKVYSTIGFVNGKGSTTARQQYNYVDAQTTSGKYFYRLRQVDFDGTSKYSQVIAAGEMAPTAFELSQNFPNPFNPVTSIKYAIANAQQVTLKVFNILGTEVAVLVNEKKEAGTYNVNFSSVNLASGTYIYRLQAGNYSKTMKMLLVK